MYTVEDLKNRVAEEGLEAVLNYLTSADISAEEIEALKGVHILSAEGFPCLSLIYSLVLIAQ